MGRLRSLVAVAVLVVSTWQVAGCSPRRPQPGPPYDIGVVAQRLEAAHYNVTMVPPDQPLAALVGESGVQDVTCVEAMKDGSKDRFCVVRCADVLTCVSLQNQRGKTGESYGVMQEGASLLVHQLCALFSGRSPPFDCVPARRAIGLL